MSGREESDAMDDAELRGFDDFDTRLGDIMRGERATLGKSLLDVQRELRIKATYIAAIENTDPSAFDTPSFVAGYVRSYARYLGLDQEWAYGEFCREGHFVTKQPGGAPGPVGGAAKPDSGRAAAPTALGNTSLHLPPAPSSPLRLEPGALGSVAVLLVLIGALGYGGYAVLKQIQQVHLAPVEQSPSPVSALDTLEGVEAATEAPIRTAAVEPPTLGALDRLYRPEALKVPVVTARDGPISMVEPGSIGVFTALQSQAPRPGGSGTPQLTSVAEAADPADDSSASDPIDDAVARALGAGSQRAAPTPDPEVVLVAVRPAWVRVRADDGTVLLEKTLQSEETYRLPETDAPPTLRAGNSGAVFFMVGGETYGPAAPGAQVIDDVVLGPEALRERYEVAEIEESGELARLVAALKSAP